MGVKIREKVKGSGEWWIFIDHQGKRTSRKIGSKTSANEVKKGIEKRIGDRKFSIDSDIPTFSRVADEWLNTIIKPTCSSTTYVRYNGILKNYILPTLKNCKINTINRGNIKTILLGIKAEGLSRSQVELAKQIMSGIFKHARDHEYIKENPCDGIMASIKLEKRRQIDIDPFDQNEIDQFLKTCSSTFNDEFPFFLTAFRTGMRLGELLALLWGDIDWNGKFITVQRSYRKGEVVKTKTGEKRRVDLSDGLLDELKKLYTKEKIQGLEMGLGGPVKIIFHRSGEHIQQKFMRRKFYQILKSAGLRKIRFHDIRHTYASQLISRGANIKYVSTQMGHSSIDITLDIYAKYMPQGDHSEVNLLENNPSFSHPIRTQQKI